VDERKLIFDPDALAELIGDDPELRAELITLFNDECPRLVESIRGALDSGDAAALTHAAHTLKGSAANLGAANTREAAHGLEALGRGGDLGAGEPAWGRLQRALADLEVVLSEYAARA